MRKQWVTMPMQGLPGYIQPQFVELHAWEGHLSDLQRFVAVLLIAEKMRLKSKVLASPMDSSIPMVFVAGSSINSRPFSTAQGKPWKPCFNFAKGNCCYGDSCRYVCHTP
ncbi:ribonuclease H-like domain-containing protein [Tanacetum coccineum]